MKTTFRLFLAAVGLASMTSAAGAQILPPDIQRELEMTDLRIERAETIVAGSDNDAARLELQQAVLLQTRAKEEFAAGHPRIALDLTYRARGHADRAIALVRGLPDPDRVRAQLDRTRELVERVRDPIEECGNERARAMLHAATEMQRRAEAAAAASRYLAALQLTRGARERALDALRLCNLQEDLRDSSERALRRLASTQPAGPGERARFGAGAADSRAGDRPPGSSHAGVSGRALRGESQADPERARVRVSGDPALRRRVLDIRERRPRVVNEARLLMRGGSRP